jgi:tetratricopeptide (TPR) repeat protein
MDSHKTCTTGTAFDALLCSHHDDKEFASDIYKCLHKHKPGIQVFYGEETILWGDPVIAKIDSAIWQCKKAVVIISNSLVKSTKKEKEQVVIESLLSRQWDVKKNLVLPLLLGVTVEKFRRHYPILATIKPLEANLVCPDEIALQLLKILEMAEMTEQGWSVQPSIHSRPLPPVGECLGRDEEQTALLNKITNPDVHVCCVHGLPGVGKTILGKAVAHALVKKQSANEGTEWKATYVSLRDHESQDQCLQDILQAFGQDVKEGQEFTQVQSFLNDTDIQNHVLVLDACDKAIRYHLAQFQSLLYTLASSFKIITTSLTSYVSMELKLSYHQLKPFDANTAQSVLCCLSNNIVIEKPVATVLVKLCHCMPIAIQILAAALQAEFFSPDQLLDFLLQDQDSCGVHSTVLDKMDRLAEQTSPNHAVSLCIEAAYMGLSPLLQQQLTLLSLFQGSFSAKACAVVLNMENKSRTLLKVLGPLKQCSLLEPSKGVCYTIHGSIIEFLKRKFKLLPKEVHILAVERFCTYYGKRLERASAHFLNNSKLAVIKFEKNRGNFEELFHFATDAASYDWYRNLVINAEGLLRVTLSVDHRCKLFKTCAKAAKKQQNEIHCAALTLSLVDSQLDASNIAHARQSIQSIAPNEDVLDQRLLLQYRVLEASVLTSEDDPYGATKLLMASCFGEDSGIKSYPMLEGKALVALGNATVALDDQCAAIGHYEEAIKLMTAAVHSSCGPDTSKVTHPDICSIRIQIAHCDLQMGNYDASYNHFLEALVMQRLLSCDRLSRAITTYHIGIAKAGLMDVSKPPNSESVVDDALGYICAARDDAIRLSSNHPLIMLASLAAGSLLFLKGLIFDKKYQRRAQECLENALESFLLCNKCCEESAEWKNSLMNLEALAHQTIIRSALYSKDKDLVKKLRSRCIDLAEVLFPQNYNNLPAAVAYVMSEKFPKVLTGHGLAALRLSFNKDFISKHRFAVCMEKSSPPKALTSKAKSKLGRRSKAIAIASSIASRPSIQPIERSTLMNWTSPSPETSTKICRSGRTTVYMHREPHSNGLQLQHGSQIPNLPALLEEDHASCSSSEVSASDTYSSSPEKTRSQMHPHSH